jgi:hypothetical protein
LLEPKRFFGEKSFLLVTKKFEHPASQTRILMGPAQPRGANQFREYVRTFTEPTNALKAAQPPLYSNPSTSITSVHEQIRISTIFYSYIAIKNKGGRNHQDASCDNTPMARPPAERD